MTGYVVLILVVMVGGVVLIGVLTQLAEGLSREWKGLAARFPMQSPAPDATRGEARIRVGTDPERFWSRGCLWFFMPWTWTRGLRQIRYGVDDDFLHMETEGGRFVPRSGMSIPWSQIEVEGQVSTHMGMHSLLWVGEVAIGFPSVQIARELDLRAGAAAMEQDEDEAPWTEEL